jgi:selenocysteine-specific translation elongation factor
MIKLEKSREKLEDNMLGLKEAQKNSRWNGTFQTIIDHAFQVRL